MIPARELQRHLRHVADQEKIRVSDAALALVARAAEGSVRDALSLFDQVLAFTGDAVVDDEVAGLLGLVDRELLHRATRAIVEGSSLAMLELVESLADYGADYRNFVRELLLFLREVLLAKLAPEGSPLLAQLLPEEAEVQRSFAGALSEEDLLRGLDLLTQAEADLRSVTDPRVALDLVLLKLVQMRRLVPFAEVVARVERLAGGAPPSPAPGAQASPQRSLLEPRSPAPPFAAPGPATAPPPRASSPPPPSAPPPAPAPPAVAAAGSPQALLAAIIGLCHARPSLAAPLRMGSARRDGEALVLEVPPDFLTLASEHVEEYRALARKAAGRAIAVRIEGGAHAAAGEARAAAEPSPEAARRQKLREEAEREPAVQEALDLFDGRVLDVKEAPTGREDA
jgi:DNA polymerase-3 subunit gamma/tau